MPDLLPADWADVPRDQRPVTLEVDHLVKHFPLTGGGMFRRTIGQVAAVDDVTFKIRQGRPWHWSASPAPASPPR